MGRLEVPVPSGNVENATGLAQQFIRQIGPGIPPEWRHKAFEPFFTVKNGTGRHIGTGLSRAQQVVADHGGIIDLEESASGGCAVIVEFRLDGDPI
jgi:C4-dicarboxylate-specific signal transduction histidine kinase